jgi:hypothetical protein
VSRVDRREPVGDPTGADRLVPLMADLTAAATLFFDVGDLAERCHLTIAAGDTPALQRREPKKSNETHLIL